MKIKTLLILLCLSVSVQAQPQRSVTMPILINGLPAEKHYNIVYQTALALGTLDTLSVLVDTLVIDEQDLVFFVNPDSFMVLILTGKIQPRKARVIQYTPGGLILNQLDRMGRSDNYNVQENRGQGFILLPEHRGGFNKFLNRGKSLEKRKRKE